jgi:hypothetical protein
MQASLLCKRTCGLPSISCLVVTKTNPHSMNMVSRGLALCSKDVVMYFDYWQAAQVLHTRPPSVPTAKTQPPPAHPRSRRRPTCRRMGSPPRRTLA